MHPPPIGLFARTFRSLRHRNYALYFTGQLVSFTGSWMQSAALMWLAFAITQDEFWPPLMLVAAVGPTLVLGPLGGSLADRHSKKTLILITQSAFLLSATALTFCVGFDRVEPLLLLALQFFNGLVQAIDLPARLAFVTELIPREDLINAVGLNSLTFNLARALGPALAGGLFIAARYAVEEGWSPIPIVRLGAVACFSLNALSYLAVLAALSRIHVMAPVAHPSHTRGRFWDGLRFLREKPGLMALIVLTGVLSIFGWPVLTLLPAYTKSVLGMEERAYSFLVSSLGAGALVGSLVTASFGTPNRRERALFLGSLCTLAGMLGLLLASTLVFAIPSCMVFGFGLILYLSTGQSTMQLDSPDTARGKVMAFWAMTLSGAAIPGHLLAGLAARHYAMQNVMFVLWLGVAATVIGILILAMSGKLRPS